MSKHEFLSPISAIILLSIALSAMLSGCGLNRWLALEPGVYRPAANVATAGPIESVEVVRENQLATFHLADGSRTVVSFSSRDKADWPAGCPANIGSTYMEVLEIADRPLTIGELSFEEPILVRDCPADPERIALREDGPVGGGTACAGLDKCLHLLRRSQTALELTVPIANTKPLPRSMKGYELYSWHDEESDSWRYTLITGTNRLKMVEEITAGGNQENQGEWVKITVAGTEDLKALLERLPPGTEVSWRGGEWLESEGQVTENVTLPEPGVVEAIQEHCRQLDIQLKVIQEDLRPTPEETAAENTPEAHATAGRISRIGTLMAKGNELVWR